MRARRALLYTPGDDPHKIQKAFSLQADCVCLDLEDGVALSRKAAAREIIPAALQSVRPGRSERLVRLNAAGSGLAAEDLQAVLPARPDGIVLPKVEGAAEIEQVSREIAAAERRLGWPEGEIALIAIVETARGIASLAEIAAASPRLQALVFGAEDLAVNLGARRSREGWEVFYARSAVVLHAAAAGLQAIDMVNVDFHDLEGLRREALQGAQMGFSGKQVIHPNQVEPVQQAFTPDETEIEEAVRLVQAFEERQKRGVGAFALDGKMVDAPTVKAAERVLARARAAGKLASHER